MKNLLITIYLAWESFKIFLENITGIAAYKERKFFISMCPEQMQKKLPLKYRLMFWKKEVIL